MGSFNVNYNGISSTFNKTLFREAVGRFIAVGFWMAIPVAIYNLTPVYQHLRGGIQEFLLLIFGLYILFGLPIFYFYRIWFTGPRLDSKAVIALQFLPQIPVRVLAKLRNPSAAVFIEEKTRVAFLATIIKVFFLPLMVSGVISNGYALIASYPKVLDGGFSEPQFAYAILVSTLILIDASIFAFGYLVESVYFQNEIKSVEPTFVGWAVALVSYQPFNTILNRFERTVIPPIPIDLSISNQTALIVFLALSVCCYGIYVWASVALGPRAGNLVNRGIVWGGPYAFIRHPAYISKNLAWWFALIPVMTDIRPMIVLCIAVFIYLLRAITEERHLNTDPEYVAYCKRVRYRFIPFVI